MADIKTRRRRRVTLLLLIVVALVGGGAAFVWVSQWKREQQEAHALAEGKAAYEAGDYAGAIDRLGRYLERQPKNSEAQMMFAQSNLKLPGATPRQMKAGIDALAAVVLLDADNEEATRQLIEMYKLSGQDEKSLVLAERLLAKDAKDAEALRAKAVALTRLKKDREALEAAKLALEADPKAHQMQLLVMQLRSQLGEPADILVADAEKALAEHPDDPVFQLLTGYAYALAGDQASSSKWLRAAAEQKTKDPQLAYTLVQVLDASGMFNESLGVLAEAATPANESGLFTELLQRLFEASRHQEVVERTQGLELASKDTRIDDLTMRAMSLYQLGRRDEAKVVTDALGARRGAPVAVAWSKVLEQVHASPSRPVPETIQVLKDAMPTLLANAYLHAFLGDAHAAVGDSELALVSWQRAAELRSTWGGVRTLIAKAMLGSGQPEEALRYAQEALARQPGSVEAAVTLLRARAAQLPQGDQNGGRALLRLIDEVQKAAPGEPQTLLLRVSLLGQIGDRAAAKTAAQAVLAHEPKLPESLLLQLAEVSRRYDLGVEGQAYAQVEKQSGQTPELALSRAMDLSRHGKAAEGLALLEAGEKAAGASGDMPEAWRFAVATFLDNTNNPRAPEVWIKLADDFPQNSRVQRAALRARSVQEDRAFTGRVIDRLEKLMGDDSVGFRLEKARWLLNSPNVESDADTAGNLLRAVIAEAPKRLEPRLLLARALERQHREELAIQELRKADQAIPGSLPVLLELARLHQGLRQFPEASDAAQQVLASSSATESQKRDAAVLLAQQGEDAPAIRALEGIVQAGDAADNDERLMLASLYFRSGNPQKAETITQELLAQDPSSAALSFALRFYGAQGRQADVQRVLGLVQSGDSLSDAERRRVLADFYATSGDAKQAAEMYEAGVSASPKSSDAWRQLVAFHLSQGAADEAIGAAERGLKELPDDGALQTVRANAELVRKFAGADGLRSLLLMLVGDEEDREIGAEVLRLVASSGDRVDAALAEKLRSQADAHPDVLPLQLAAVRASMEVRQFREAAAVAARAARTFPTSAEPAWLHAESLAATGQWIDVLGAAGEWKSRLNGSTRAPDLLLAEARLRLRQPAEALAVIQPHVKEALAAPNDNIEVVARYVRALVGSGRTNEASRTLLPLAPQHNAWRLLAMQQAAGVVQDPVVAAQWLDVVAQNTPADATSERTLLSQSWWALAQRTNKPEYAARAQELVAVLTSDANAGAQAWYMRALIAEGSGKTEEAQSAYREALSRDPNLSLAQNNLAMLLVTQGDDVAEALKLAEAAVKTEPSNTSFIDTLAVVQAKAGQCDAGQATIRKAIELEPDNPQWKKTLADILEGCGKAEEAKAIREQIGVASPGLGPGAG